MVQTDKLGLTYFDILQEHPTRPISSDEVKRLTEHYGLIWDSTSDKMKEICGLKFITREGYIRKNLKYYHGLVIQEIGTE
jgi:hypothetical protein